MGDSSSAIGFAVGLVGGFAVLVVCCLSLPIVSVMLQHSGRGGGPSGPAASNQPGQGQDGTGSEALPPRDDRPDPVEDEEVRRRPGRSNLAADLPDGPPAWENAEDYRRELARDRGASTGTPTSTSPSRSSSSTSSSDEDAPYRPYGPRQTWRGRGDVSREVGLNEGVALLDIEYDGQRNFIVGLHNGRRRATLVNTIGSYSGTVAAPSLEGGDYELQVQSSGPWTIQVRQPWNPVATAGSRWSGRGDDVTGFVQLGPGLQRFHLSHQGDHNFIVTVRTEDGGRVRHLVNEIGDYDGSRSIRLPRGGYFLEVRADGPWRIRRE